MGSNYGSGAYGAGDYGEGDSATLLSAFQAGLNVLVEIAFADSISTYYSGQESRFDGYAYIGKLISAGNISRNMQKSLGIFEASSVELIFADHDRSFAQQQGLGIPYGSGTYGAGRYGTKPDPYQFKGATVTVKMGDLSMHRLEYRTVMIGKIDEFGVDGFTYRVVVSDPLFSLPEFPDVGTVNETDFPNALPDHKGQPLPVCYGEHSVTVADDARDRGAWPTLYVDNTTNAKKFLVAGHHVEAIEEVYAILGGVSTLLVNVTDYTAVPAGTIAGENVAYIQFTDAQFNAKLTDVNGNLAVVVCNVHGKADAAGDLMTNPVDVIEDLLNEYCGAPTLDDGAFDLARTIAADRSYAVRGGYVDRVSTASVLQELCRSFNMRLYQNIEGEVGINILAPAFLLTERDFTEQRDILQGSFSVDHEASIEGAEDSQIINHVEYLADFHYAKQKFFKSDIYKDDDSIAVFGEKRLQLSASWADALSAFDVAQRVVFQFAQPVPHVNFRVPLSGLNVDLGDLIGVSHAMGADGQALVDEVISILSHSINPLGGTVGMRGINVTALTTGGWFFDDEDARARTALGTAEVSNGSAVITIVSGPASLITAGVVIGDTIRLKSGVNISNHEVLAVTATTVTVAQAIWTNETGISYDILPSWETATDDQKLFGHLCDDNTGTFPDGAPGKALL